MTRYSTTAKITLASRLSILLHTRKGDGVIVRLRGVEYGIIAVVPHSWIAIDVEGREIDLRQCTIRKGLPTASQSAELVAA